MRTGMIIDFYDDLQGTVLKEKVAQAALPDYIKEAQFLNEEAQNKLPDDVYALVMVDQGNKMRKYACVDRGNTALSVLYFLENQHKLPEEAQKTAAANLMTACGWHDIDPPMVLEKAAKAEKPGMAARFFGTKKAREYDVQQAMEFAKQQKAKGVKGYELLTPKDKTASAMNPYVDVTGKSAPPRFEKVGHQRFCLVKEGEARFPIDSYGQVEQAERWFSDHSTSLHPKDRREYCIKLAARAEELGHQINDRIKKYAAEGYAPDGEIRVGVCSRMQCWSEGSQEHGMLKNLMNKYASVPPEVFCESLRQFDEATGMHHRWDDGVYDPWYTTYGLTKKAETVWTHGNDSVTTQQLKDCSATCAEQLKKNFGGEMAMAFRKNPEQIFNSLPLDTKRIISRMVTDNQ